MSRTILLLFSLVLLGCSVAFAQNLTVTIVSQPVLTGQVGVPYSYDVDAVSSNPAASLTYTLRGNPPQGMTIDAATGLVSWTPGSNGAYDVRIRVKARLGDIAEAEAEQEYTLRIGLTGGGSGGSLRGTVRNGAGIPVRLVEVKMFDPAGDRALFKTRTDSAGTYRIAGVLPGTYYVKADPPDMGPYEDQWFDGVRRFEQATPVVMTESSAVVIDFILAARDSDDFRRIVTGVVRGQGGQPLAGARVSFFRVHRDDPPGSHQDDNRRRERDDVEHVFTDSLGEYQVRLRGRTYVATAFKEGYRRQYWDHQTTAAAANRLTLVADTSGIDFDLVPIAPVVGGGTPAGENTAGRVDLQQNYPNPFNPATSISFTIPSDGYVRLSIHNILGQTVATLVDGELGAGVHQVEWRADGTASGLYFSRIEFGAQSQVRQMMLVR